MKNAIPAEIIDIVLEELQIGLTLVNDEGKVIYFNSLARKLLNWDTSSDNNSILPCHSLKTQEKVIHKLSHMDSKAWHRIIRREGRHIENFYSPITIPGKLMGAMIISKDVTARENKYSDIKKSANTDNLTGLYSRQFLENMIRKYESAPTAYGLIMIDINGLKYINDNFSHNAGDAMLVKTAEIIRENVRKKDLVFRLGGDEFLILTTADEKTARQIISRIKEQNMPPSKANPLVLNLSLGYAGSEEKGSFQETLSLADQRMYEDKKAFYENEGKFFRQ